MDNWAGVCGLAGVLMLLLFSTLSLAMNTLSRSKLSAQLDRVGKNDLLDTFLSKRASYLRTTSILRSTAVLAIFVGALYSWGVSTSDDLLHSPVLACAAAWATMLVFGIAIPTAWAKYAGEWLIVKSLPLLSVARWLCHPLNVLLGVFDPLIRRLAGVPAGDARSYADQLEQDILDAVTEGERHGAVDEEEKEMIESVIELSDTCVDEIMTPRTDIIAIPKETDLDTVLELLRTKGHSRIPVYDGTIDTILGVLYVKDLLRRPNDTPFELTKIMRSVLFIPESKPVRELLREFQSKKVHIAAVLDEYGGTAGLVTIEDILEELVGEILDEYETETPAELERIDDEHVEVDARMRIDQLNDELDIELPEDEDFETIGGFVFSHMGKIPTVGETCEHENIAIRVLAADPRRILRLRLHIPISGSKGDKTGNRSRPCGE